MPAPVIANTQTATGTGDATVTKPTGTVAGDLLLFVMNTRNLTPDHNGPQGAGWTCIYQRDIGTNEWVVGWTKVAGGSEPASYTITNTSVGTSGFVAICARITGAASIHAVMRFGGHSTPDAFVEAESLAIGHWSSSFTDTGSYSAVPSGMTEIANVTGTNATHAIIGYQEIAADTELQPLIPANTLTSNQQFKSAVLIVVKPTALRSKYWALASDGHIEYPLGGGLFAGGQQRVRWLIDQWALSPANAAVWNGDLYDTGTDGTSAGAKSDAASRFQGLNFPVYFGGGNHDFDDGDSITDPSTTSMDAFYDSLGDTELTQTERERGYFIRLIDGVHHMVLNAVFLQAPTEGAYEYGATQKSWITSTLATLTGSGIRLIVYTHLDVINGGTAWHQMTATDATFLRTELETWKASSGGLVLAVISAHEHGLVYASLNIDRVTTINGIRYINLIDGYTATNGANVKALAASGTQLHAKLLHWNEPRRTLRIYSRSGQQSYKLPFGSLVSPGSDSDAAAYIAAVESADGAALEQYIKNAITAFVIGCKADQSPVVGVSNWSAIKAACILAGARTLSGCLVPLKGTAPTNTAFVSGDYSRSTGLKGNGTTKQLSSGRNVTTDPQDNHHMAVYVTEHHTPTPGGFYIGGGWQGAAENGTSIGVPGSGFSNFFISSTDTAHNMAYRETGFMGLARTGSTTLAVRSGNLTESSVLISKTRASQTIHVFNTSSGSTARANGRLAWYSIGESVDLAMLQYRLDSLMSEIANGLASPPTPLFKPYIIRKANNIGCGV